MFHVLNRGDHRMETFQKPQDYAAFERVMCDAAEHTGIPPGH